MSIKDKLVLFTATKSITGSHIYKKLSFKRINYKTDISLYKK